eukprot:1178093-Prorocentrum_minimum.AAC.1
MSCVPEIQGCFRTRVSTVFGSGVEGSCSFAIAPALVSRSPRRAVSLTGRVRRHRVSPGE